MLLKAGINSIADHFHKRYNFNEKDELNAYRAMQKPWLYDIIYN
jgi:hypothetical protein